MRPKIPLPRAWNRRAKSAILYILALSHYAFTAMLARAANERSRRTRFRAEIDRLNLELALLREELRIKDARMERVPPHKRPHYTPLERMAIMELRAARGWSARQAAGRLHVSMTTLASWKARIDEDGPNALLQTAEPVNKFPDLIRYIVRRLKLLCPQLGKVKIAEMLCRAGLHLAPTTVGRMLKEEPDFPEPVAAANGPVVTAATRPAPPCPQRHPVVRVGKTSCVLADRASIALCPIMPSYVNLNRFYRILRPYGHDAGRI